MSFKVDDETLLPVADDNGPLVLDMTNNNVDTWKVRRQNVISKVAD